jgi:hypothetical protein
MSGILLRGLILVTRIHRTFFSTISKLKISKLSLFTHRDLTAKSLSSTLELLFMRRNGGRQAVEGSTVSAGKERAQPRWPGMGTVDGEQGSEECVREREGVHRRVGKEERGPSPIYRGRVEEERGAPGREETGGLHYTIDGHQWWSPLREKEGETGEEKGAGRVVSGGRTAQGRRGGQPGGSAARRGRCTRVGRGAGRPGRGWRGSLGACGVLAARLLGGKEGRREGRREGPGGARA